MFVALFLAGYYVWRADHIRLIPQFEIVDVCLVEAVPTLRPENRSGDSKEIVQLVLKCVSDAPVEGCEGLLQAIYRWENGWWDG